MPICNRKNLRLLKENEVVMYLNIENLPVSGTVYRDDNEGIWLIGMSGPIPRIDIFTFDEIKKLFYCHCCDLSEHTGNNYHGMDSDIINCQCDCHKNKELIPGSDCLRRGRPDCIRCGNWIIGNCNINCPGYAVAPVL